MKNDYKFVVISDEDFTDVDQNGIIYRIYDDYAEVITQGNCKDGEIVIPESIEGVPVKRIGMSAFSNYSGLRKITILNNECEIFDSSITICNGMSKLPQTVDYKGK